MEYYPIGTIVSVEGLPQNVMICGLYMEMIETGKVYDYAAINFPSGYSPDGELHVFNQDNIREVKHMGFANVEHCVFVENINMYYKQTPYENNNYDLMKDINEQKKGDEQVGHDQFVEL